MAKKHSRTSSRAIQTRQRWAQCLELRRAGATYPEIAAAMGYTAAKQALRAVQSALKECLEEPAEDVRRFEVSRLERLLRAHWMGAVNGDQAASSTVLGCLDRIHRLKGLHEETRGGDVTIRIERTGARGAEDWRDARVVEAQVIESVGLSVPDVPTSWRTKQLTHTATDPQGDDIAGEVCGDQVAKEERSSQESSLEGKD